MEGIMKKRLKERLAKFWHWCVGWILWVADGPWEDDVD